MKKSASIFIEHNGKTRKQLDENGNPQNGIRVYAKDYDKGKKTLIRFRNGFLDGDLFDSKGNFIMQKPAVESEGHQEYWRKGKLHRDNGEPAVISEGFSVKEWWLDGERQEHD